MTRRTTSALSRVVTSKYPTSNVNLSNSDTDFNCWLHFKFSSQIKICFRMIQRSLKSVSITRFPFEIQMRMISVVLERPGLNSIINFASTWLHSLRRRSEFSPTWYINFLMAWYSNLTYVSFAPFLKFHHPNFPHLHHDRIWIVLYSIVFYEIANFYYVLNFVSSQLHWFDGSATKDIIIQKSRFYFWSHRKWIISQR